MTMLCTFLAGMKVFEIKLLTVVWWLAGFRPWTASVARSSDLHYDSYYPILRQCSANSLDSMPCPIARSLERVGEWWSMLIMRDALHGLHAVRRVPEEPRHRAQHADAPAQCAGRGRHCWNAAATASTRRATNTCRPRAGAISVPVLVALLAWGNRHFAPEGASVQLVDAETGAAVDPILVDRATGRPITEPDYAFAAGPAAPERTRRRYASIARRTRASRRRARAGASRTCGARKRSSP